MHVMVRVTVLVRVVVWPQPKSEHVINHLQVAEFRESN
jgi:hypothetical protein